MKSHAAAFVLSCLLVSALPAADRVELSLRAGPDWSHTKWFGPFPASLSPQIAIWLEDSSGRWAADLFVTQKAGKSSWGEVRRPEALPVWSHARGKRYPDGLFMPTKADPLPDAVAGATPKPKGAAGEIALAPALPAGLPAGRYRVMVEVNSSFDYCPAYPEKRNDVNGQPSLVYAISVELGAPVPADAAGAVILGTGDPAGADGEVRPGTAGLDSALRIVADLKARVVRD